MYDYSPEECISILREAIGLSIGTDLNGHIERFQAQVWGKGFGEADDDPVLALLLGIAADLDMYESNLKWRAENDAYYGEDVAVQKIKEYLNMIELLRKDI